MSTPPQQKQSSRSVARHPAARALQEQLDEDAPQREAQVIDKMLFSPVQGEEGKVGVYNDKYLYYSHVYVSDIVGLYIYIHLIARSLQFYMLF